MGFHSLRLGLCLFIIFLWGLPQNLIHGRYLIKYLIMQRGKKWIIIEGIWKSSLKKSTWYGAMMAGGWVGFADIRCWVQKENLSSFCQLLPRGCFNIQSLLSALMALALIVILSGDWDGNEEGLGLLPQHPHSWELRNAEGPNATPDLNESRSANPCFPGSPFVLEPPASYLLEVCATAVCSNYYNANVPLNEGLEEHSLS